MCSISVILVCQFHLELHKRNSHPNGTPFDAPPPSGSFKAATQQVHGAIIEEFGDLNFNESLGGELSQGGIGLQDVESHHTEEHIDLQEFPWETGELGEIEAAAPVA